MVVFLLQIRDTVDHHRLYLFTVFVSLIWIVWFWKMMLSRRYEPFRTPCGATASVIIPVVDEPEQLFREVLRRITEQRPLEVIVVINGPENHALEAICNDFADRGVRWRWTPIPGKRNAVKVGVEESVGEISVLVDSDTIWMPDVLPELLKPFADPLIGGVTTNQRILAPHRHVLTRWADWMESVRSCYSMPAMSVLGQVGCLPGRTIAIRRHVIIDALPTFMHGRFMGVFVEVSDDRTLTNETLKQGYKTVFQSTSLVYTDAPTTWKKMAKQQFRWARGSQYNTLRMLPWMLRHTPTLAFFYICDIVLPFMLLGTLTGWIYRQLAGTEANLFEGMIGEYGKGWGFLLVVAVSGLGVIASSAIRQSRHLARRPADLWRMPAFIVISTFLLQPVRLYGFVRMAHASGWGTRAGGYQGERKKNPLAIIPYLLAALLVVAGVLYHA
jgi:cellulose synthase/poly-beta-1,6-N-acetylglucosamine synthase-like glycosyltransferase